MDIKEITKTIFEKKGRDNFFIIFFLLVFSVFIFFAIKPSLTTAYSLKKEVTDLTNVDKVYEEKIDNIMLIQSQIEENRDALPLLNQAIPQNPEVNKIVEDVKRIADNNSLTIVKANIVNINFTKSVTSKQTVELKMEMSADFESVKNFIGDLYNQRRLKLIDNILISRDKESSDSGNLGVTLTIDGYYL